MSVVIAEIGLILFLQHFFKHAYVFICIPVEVQDMSIANFIKHGTQWCVIYDTIALQVQ